MSTPQDENYARELDWNQVHPVFLTLRHAADVYEANQSDPRLTTVALAHLYALRWVAKALDPDAAAADRLHAKRRLRFLVREIENMWRKDVDAPGVPTCWETHPDNPIKEDT